jgi:hypothetical protein
MSGSESDAKGVEEIVMRLRSAGVHAHERDAVSAKEWIDDIDAKASELRKLEKDEVWQPGPGGFAMRWPAGSLVRVPTPPGDGPHEH